MPQVLHIFKKHAVILKPDYTPDFRKSFFEWENQLTSRLGIIKDGQLLLANEYKELINVSRTGTVIIQDIIGYSGSNKMDYLQDLKKMNFPEWYIRDWLKRFPEIITFNKEDRVQYFGPFSINLQNKELFLKDSYKLCVLEIGQSIRIRLNAKSDFTASSGKQRTYYESDYIIQFLGEVDSIEFVSDKTLEIQREIPWKTAKAIDLRKAYY